MKITTTLYDILQSELIKDGHNEFVNKNQLTFFDRDYAFIRKIMLYDEDVQSIVDDIFFQDIQLVTPESDKLFKKTFINRFYNREIGFQTVEAFSSQVVYVTLTNYDYLNNLYDNLDDYLTGKKISNTDDTGKDTSDNRYASSTLPQSLVNIDVDNTELDYGDVNNISKTKNEKTGNTKNDSNDFNIDNLIKSRGLLEEIFIDFDRKCFLQTW